ncbi:putative MPP superfamily phosphohydrolase [Pontibacter aydingkolensis]|uniref:Metallophosphoesterase n=1 Tax=Pontibacter aydingkolensis TaxID=1911536 RepID=A0ABS7CVD5_9BACT|nr:metallophosphoesterase [Pontibacter aydingkolensis]MBW7467826.1 metallophosphoesterase [Pontibacter aydingkolensis]
MNRCKDKKRWALGAAAAVAGYLLLRAFVLEKYFFQVRRYRIGDRGGRRVIRLVLLADLHFRRLLLPQHRRLARRVNRLRPDLILIAGDTLDAAGGTGPMEEFFRLLDERTRKAAVLGNHDYRASPSVDELRRAYGRHGCDLLVNETRVYRLGGTELAVTGLDDLIEGESSVEKALGGVGRQEHHLMLVHSPLQQETAMAGVARLNRARPEGERLRIRYIFAGHNHGGQVRLPFWVPVLPPSSGDYVEGWYNDSEPFLYVSRGFGTSTLPLRFLARSEVTLFNYFA